MTCDNCGADLPPDFDFCGKCGSKLGVDPLQQISTRLTVLERNYAERHDNRFVEIDLAERVATRLMNWAKLFGLVVGVPMAVFLAALVLITGKSFKDLRDVATGARESIETISSEAKRNAGQARDTATQAAAQSEEIAKRVAATKREIADLNTATEQRVVAVRNLGESIGKSQAAITLLQKDVTNQSAQVINLSRQVQAINTEKNALAIGDVYPSFGQRVVGGASGWIDASKKKPAEIYVDLLLAVQPNAKPKIEQAKVAQFMSILKDHGFTVYLGPFALYVSSGRTSQGIVQIDDSQACLSTTTSHRPPCIIYFHQDLKNKATELASLVRDTQQVDPGQIAYSDPKTWGEPWNELIQKSGIDLLIVLGNRD